MKKVAVTMISVVLVMVLCCYTLNADDVFSFHRPINDQINEKYDGLCPNNRTKCSSSGTCCKTKHNSYHCCRYRNAVCCPDKFHCCPQDSTCNTDTKRCDRNNPIEWKVENNEENEFKMLKLSKSKDLLIKPTFQSLSELKPADTLTSSIERFLSLINVEKRCGNTVKECPGEKKCCTMLNGQFGCCKFRKGVCCPDLATCCPHDTQCDVKNKACTTVSENLVPVENLIKEPFVNCPDNLTKCSSSETCCSVGKVLYGCCPMKDATCCSNKRSCCPHTKKCDSLHNRCVGMDEDVTEESYPIKTNRNRKIFQPKSLMIFLNNFGLKLICPDHGNCPEHSTCCSVGGGRFGCCPYSEAICCPNLTTCCPHNMRCRNNDCV